MIWCLRHRLKICRKGGEPVLKKLLKRFSGGIINKLFLLILITVLLCAVVFFSITGYQNKMLSDLSIETSNRQQYGQCLYCHSRRRLPFRQPRIRQLVQGRLPDQLRCPHPFLV